jgi:hypothetical protein
MNRASKFIPPWKESTTRQTAQLAQVAAIEELAR